MEARSVDRLPPHASEAECGILGCVMLSPQESLALCGEALEGKEAFYDLRHQTIYEGMVRMWSKSEPIELVTLYQHFKDEGLCEQCGGLSYLMTLTDAVPSAANLPSYLKIVIEKWRVRRVIRACASATEKLYKSNGDWEMVIDEVERDVLAACEDRQVRDATSIQPAVRSALEDIEARWEKKGTIGGMTTGLKDLDGLTDGLHDGELIVIAAYPSVGKSSLALNIAQHVAVELKQPVGIFSLEMSARSLATRAVCGDAEVGLRRVRDGFLVQSDFPKLTTAAGRISHSAMFIDDSPDLSIMQLRAKARRLWQRHKIRLWVVDYVQLCSGRGDNREQEVASVSRGLKALATETGATVLALSQLNDDGKLRESRAIGQDADSVWVLEAAESKSENNAVSSVKLKVRKQRNGPTGLVDLVFFKEFTRFKDAAKTEETP